MNPYAQDNNSYLPSRYRKTVFIVVGALVVVIILAIVTTILHPNQQTKYNRSATAAARKNTPNAKVNDVKVADGFAIAVVKDPTASGQSKAGSTIVFKVNTDGSMKQIASGSSLSTLYLLGLGISLPTQAKLTNANIATIKQNLTEECNYDEDGPGYNGFEGSFNPDGWQIDASTLDNIQSVLTKAVNDQNIKANSNNVISCVNTTSKNSNRKTDRTTFVTTYTLRLQFVFSDGKITKHTFTFSTDPENYTLDGRQIFNPEPKATYSI